MAVPAQDERDWEFATGLRPADRAHGAAAARGTPTTGPSPATGPAINSANAEISLDGLGVAEAKATVIALAGGPGPGEGTRQLPAARLALQPPALLGRAVPRRLRRGRRRRTRCPTRCCRSSCPTCPTTRPRPTRPTTPTACPSRRCPGARVGRRAPRPGRRARRARYRRETNTMPNWAGSCWYYLRYLDPANDETLRRPGQRALLGRAAATPWPVRRRAHDPGGVDLYVGGVEHAVLHLLYARFWHKVLFDLGPRLERGALPALLLPGLHPGPRLPGRAGAVRRGPRGRGARGRGRGDLTFHGEPVQREYGKIGKSLKNSVSPDEMYDAYGADTFRVYEMSMGPLELSKPWETRAVVGAQRFLQRLWRNAVDEQTGELRRRRRRARPRDERAAAQDHRRRPRRLRGAALQHGPGQADRAQQRA